MVILGVLVAIAYYHLTKADQLFARQAQAALLAANNGEHFFVALFSGSITLNIAFQKGEISFKCRRNYSYREYRSF